MPGADELVGDVLVALQDEPLGTVVEVDEMDCATFVTSDGGEPFQQLGIRLVDPDVDLPTAGQPDAERKVVRDPKCEQPRLATGEHLPCRLDDLAFDTTSGDGTCQLAGLRDDQLRSDWPRRRPAGRDHPGHRHAVPAGTPALQLGKNFAHDLMLVGQPLPKPSQKGSGACARSPRSGDPKLGRKRSFRPKRLVAAADGFAEGVAFQLEPAAHAERGCNAGPHEQSSQQRGPEDHVRNEHLAGHMPRYRPEGDGGLAPGHS